MNLFFMLPAGRGPGVVTLTNWTATDTDIGAGSDLAVSGVRVNADGTLERLQASTYDEPNPTTDWLIPNDADPTSYYVRATEISYVETETNTALFGTKNGTMNTWLALTSAREWSLDTQSNTAGAGDISWVIDIEIASDAAGTDILEIGRYTLLGEVG
jgi:hypothetical protein